MVPYISTLHLALQVTTGGSQTQHPGFTIQHYKKRKQKGRGRQHGADEKTF